MSQPVSHTFRFCPSCGTESESVGANPFQCGACDYRFYFSPATAVGAIVTNAQGEVLFLIRARDPGQGKFGLPGGFVDTGETLENSLIREVFEETSLTVIDMQYLCSFPNSYTYRDVTVDVLDAFYVCEVKSWDTLKPQPDEVAGFHLAEPTVEVLDNLAFESNRRAIEFFLDQPKS